MSTETYWLDERDAEFVMHIVEKYGRNITEELERGQHADSGEPIYQISISRLERVDATSPKFIFPYPTLRSVLVAEASMDGGANPGETTNATD